MSHLLVKDTFDNFLLSEADIKTSCSHSIDGQINRAFYSDEEWETLEGDARRYQRKQSAFINEDCYAYVH